MRYVHTSILFLARLMISSIFIAAALDNIVNFDTNLQFMAPFLAAHGITTNLPAILVSEIIIELIGGLSVLLNLKPRLGALALFLFLIPATALFHNFWDLVEPARDEQLAHFMKSIAIGGGLLYVVACGGYCHCHRCAAHNPDAK